MIYSEKNFLLRTYSQLRDFGIKMFPFFHLSEESWNYFIFCPRYQKKWTPILLSQLYGVEKLYPMTNSQNIKLITIYFLRFDDLTNNYFKTTSWKHGLKLVSIKRKEQLQKLQVSLYRLTHAHAGEHWWCDLKLPLAGNFATFVFNFICHNSIFVELLYF